MQKSKINSKALLIGFVIFIAAMFIIPRLTGSNNDNNNDTNTNNPPANTTQNQPEDNIQLGQVVTATNVDNSGCAVDTASTFSATDAVYVVAEGGTFPRGTTVFARLYHEDQPVEDANEITANQDYNNICVNFVFEPSAGSSFQPGTYTAQFYINGNPADQVQFQVQ